MEIDGRSIGIGQEPYFIAEAGVNHNGNLTKARELIDIAVSAGADAVKFQTFSADRLASEDADVADYQKKNKLISRVNRRCCDSMNWIVTTMFN